MHVTKSDVGEGFFEFETLTLTPIDTRLILQPMLTRAELDWLNDYHKRVFETISPKLAEADKTWLEKATAPLE